MGGIEAEHSQLSRKGLRALNRKTEHLTVSSTTLKVKVEGVFKWLPRNRSGLNFCDVDRDFSKRAEERMEARRFVGEGKLQRALRGLSDLKGVGRDSEESR